jgi:Family of unknown function (DUF6510)
MTKERIVAEWGDTSLDGNAAGGALAAILGVEMTAALETCDHCGTEHVMAELRAYVGGPGIVLRCPSCADVVIRIVQRPGGVTMDLSGVRLLRLAGG